MSVSMGNKKEPVLVTQTLFGGVVTLASANLTTQYIRLCGISQQSNTDIFSLFKGLTHQMLTAEQTVSEMYSIQLQITY